MAGVQPGEVNETLKSLLRINKAPQREGMPQGGVTVVKNLNDGIYTITAVIPVEEVETSDGMLVKAVDFVEMGGVSPAPPQALTL